MNAKTAQSPLRVAVYCLIRADMGEDHSALAAQKDHFTKVIAENPDWVMAGCFVDKKQSGKPEERRAGFQRMLRSCRRGEVDLILTKNISRFARNTLDVIKYTRELRDLNIPVIFEKENLNTSSLDFECYVTFYAVFAQGEAATISRHICTGYPRMGMKPRQNARGWSASQILEGGLIK